MRNYEFVCQVCGKKHVKRIPPARENNLPKYCSNVCRFKSQELSKNYKTFLCEWCNTEFERYVSPCFESQIRQFCSRSCQMKATRNKNKKDTCKVPAGIYKFTCERCSVEFERYVKADQSARFCSRTCAARANASGRRSYAAMLERWTRKYGAERAQCMLEESKKKRSLAITKHNLGKQHSPETREKIARACTGIPNVVKGKTFTEFYGTERGLELAKQHSEKLKEGYLEGRLIASARSKSAPIFRGVKLRSLLEQRAIEFLEEKHGLEFGVTLLYEDPSTRVVWYDQENVSHVYQPDLHDVVNDVLYEVKPAWKVDKPTHEQEQKMHALRKKFADCRYLTDRDVLE